VAVGSRPFPGFAALYGRATVAQALRPFPQYQGVGTAASPYANSTYNSFQFKLDKRFSHGLTGTVAYTRSKMLSDGVGFTSAGGILRQDLAKREKFLYPTDQPNVLTLSFNYAIPFRHRWAGGWSVSGWRLFDRVSDPGLLWNQPEQFRVQWRPAAQPDGRALLVSNSSFDRT
jgi:long-subunit fatty acid transport protein